MGRRSFFLFFATAQAIAAPMDTMMRKMNMKSESSGEYARLCSPFSCCCAGAPLPALFRATTSSS